MMKAISEHIYKNILEPINKTHPIKLLADA